jgi:hypothetical protein
MFKTRVVLYVWDDDAESAFAANESIVLSIAKAFPDQEFSISDIDTYELN